MKSKKLRNFAFTLHRYIGLAVGLILVIVGLTGSLLVFANEIEHILFVQQFGTIVPQGQMLSPTSVVDTIKALKLSGMPMRNHCILTFTNLQASLL